MHEVKIEQFDSLLDDKGPAAIVLKRRLRPVEGTDSWIFPPTFAQSESTDEDDEGGRGQYQIDQLPNDVRRNVCTIDSVGSQANRIEPIFKRDGYSELVPQIKIKLKDDSEVNLLDAGHRAADAVIRFSKKFGPRLSEAFKEYQSKRDCTKILEIAPTSLVFGVWDSRATGAKIQRIVRSVVRAYDVTEAKRSAIYQPAIDYVGKEIINPVLDKGAGKSNPLSQEGFKHSPATGTHGGVTAKGGIHQEAVINLVALRVLSDATAVRRYLLGLSLVALSYRDQNAFNLREGCLLCAVSEADLNGNWTVVRFDGTEEHSTDKTSVFKDFTHLSALAFARLSIDSTRGGLNISHEEPDEFDTETAEKWLAIDKKKRKALAKTKHPARALADEAALAAAESKKKRKTPKEDQEPTDKIVVASDGETSGDE
jgi:CRISPR-associated protein Csb1